MVDVDNKVAVLNIDQEPAKSASGFDDNKWPDMTDFTRLGQPNPIHITDIRPIGMAMSLRRRRFPREYGHRAK